jgi:hypothetical protein
VVNNSGAVSYRIVLVHCLHKNVFWGKESLGKVSIISPKTDWSRRKFQIQAHGGKLGLKNKGHPGKDFTSLVLTKLPPNKIRLSL